MKESNKQINGKIAKFCDGCGKPLFKFWGMRMDLSILTIKIDVGCKRDSCIVAGTSNKTVELKLDLKDVSKIEAQVV